MIMVAEETGGSQAAIEEALEEVLGDPDHADVELFSRLRTLIGNCVADNYDESDVRAVIQLAFASDAIDEDEDD